MAWGGAILAMMLPATVTAAPPGTTIVNRATLTFITDEGIRSVDSNAVILVVGERLDVALAREGEAAVDVSASTVVAVRLTNRGTGTEAFALAAASEAAGVRVLGFAVDRDGDGRFDAAVDTVLDGATPMLSPGETLPLLAMLVPEGEDRGDGEVTLTARAVTGSGAPGMPIAGDGDGGGDAVVGSSGATARLMVPVTSGSPAAMSTAPTLNKAQEVRAPDGTAQPVSGAVVTYTLSARFPAGTTRGVRIEDVLPAATSYVAGSLLLDDVPLTDEPGDDAGEVVAGRVLVTLGDIAASIHRIRFQVRLP